MTLKTTWNHRHSIRTHGKISNNPNIIWKITSTTIDAANPEAEFENPLQKPDHVVTLLNSNLSGKNARKICDLLVYVWFIMKGYFDSYFPQLFSTRSWWSCKNYWNHLEILALTFEDLDKSCNSEGRVLTFCWHGSTASALPELRQKPHCAALDRPDTHT